MALSQNEKLWMNFRYARISQGVTQTELSKKTGVDLGQISKFELTGASVVMNTLITLCKAINLSLDECVYGDDYLKMQLIQDITEMYRDDEEYRKHVANLFKQKRKEHGYTQADLAKRMGMNSHRTRVGAIERGLSGSLSDITLYNLCKALNIGLWELKTCN